MEIKDKDKMKTRNLTQLFWEYELSEQELQDCLNKNDPSEPLTVSLYRRILLSTPNWYDVLRLLSTEQLRTALSEKVISTIHSKALQERFRFAASRLFPNR
jgi:hypothetical protein